jgi:acetylornithine/N-succinyldiaminopimelate aminotransferase
MATNADLLRVARARLYGNYKPAPFVLARGKGCEVWDVEGRRFLDLAGGVAVCSVGHSHPALARVIGEQAATLMHVSNYFYNEPNVLLADELCRRTGLDRAFFCNSGTEANEAVLKLARYHFHRLDQPKRTRILAFHNAFHGRTMGALAMTGTPKYREGFGDYFGGVTHVPYGDLAAVEAAFSGSGGDEIAAVIAEAIQGEGGVLPAPQGFLQGLRDLCDRHGALLIADEIQTGIGRVGTFLAYQQAGVLPDAVTLAKGLGGGFPIGAMLTRESLGGDLPGGTHGSTFGGNALASAAALAVLKIVDDEKLTEGAETKGRFLAEELQELARDVPRVCEGQRGKGLLQGLALHPGFVARDVLPKIQELGVLVIAAGDRVLRFAPPLVVTEAELREGVAAVRKVVEQLARA